MKQIARLSYVLVMRDFTSDPHYRQIPDNQVQLNPLNTKLRGLMKDVHVIRIIKSTRDIAGAILYFHVNQNFILSEFVLSGFDCESAHFSHVIWEKFVAEVQSKFPTLFLLLINIGKYENPHQIYRIL